MIELHLNEYTVEDLKIMAELKKAGLPDEVIQSAYEKTIKMREESKNDEFSND